MPTCTRSVAHSALQTLVLALAALAAAEGQVLEEVVVTAQKREQSVQDVGIAVTSYSGNQLEQLGYTGSLELAAQVPSMTVLSYSPALSVINIRGVSQNDFSDHFEAPVAAFVDDAYVGAQGAVDSQLMDIERVEVLRGPQGTLFGRNATGGLVHYIARRPTDSLQGYANLTLAEYNQVKFEGALAGPLSERALGRLSIATNDHEGWVDNSLGDDLNESDSLSWRAQLLLELSDSLDVLLKVSGIHNDETTAGFDQGALFVNADGLGERVPRDVDYYGTCPGCDPRGYLNNPDPWKTDNDIIGRFERDLEAVTATVSWKGDRASVTSISNFMTMDKLYASDSDGSPFNVVSRYIAEQDYEQITQELRANGELERARWVGGVYLLRIDSDQDVSAALDLTPLGPAPFLFEVNPLYSLVTRSWAVFGQIEYDIAPNWTLISGLRYTEDEKDYEYRNPNSFGIPAGFSDEASFENVSAKLELDWRPKEGWLAYASATRGHKGGSFAAPLFPPIVPEAIPHDEEVLTAFELGIKSTLFDGRARLNLAAFYYDYDDYQAFSFANLTQVISNVDAEIRGLELELVATPTDHLELSLSLSTLDGEAKDVTLPSGRVTDRKMPMTPDLDASFLVRYSWRVFAGKLAIQLDGEYVDDFNFFVLNPPQADEPSHLAGNARISFDSVDDRWQLAVFCRNISNEEHRNYTNDISALGHELDVYAPPRWFGISVGYRYR